MFTYSQKDLNTIDPILEPLIARATEHAAQTEQLAMDATRLMSVRPEQFEISAKQPFFKRLAANFNGETAVNINSLYEMQRIGWRYIEILNERDLMMAHSMITVKNNLLTLAVKEKETRELMSTMANNIADRFEELEEKHRIMEVTQNILVWHGGIEDDDLHLKYPEKLRLLFIVKEFFARKQSNWNFPEIKLLRTALKKAELPWREEITLADFIDDLIDEIEAKGFHVYDQLIALNGANGRIEQKFILENISAPSHKSLYQIADNYEASRYMIELLAAQLSISTKDAMKKVLRGFIEKEGIDTTIKIPMRDLAVELLGCHGLVVNLLLPAKVPEPEAPKPSVETPKLPEDIPPAHPAESTQIEKTSDYENMLKELENHLKSGDFEEADSISKKIIKTLTGHKVIDTKQKANDISTDVLGNLKTKWRLFGENVLTRDWVKEGDSGFTTYTGILSTTTHMQYAFKRLD